MILCVTPNPCVEHTVTVPHFRPGEVFRTTSLTVYTGGKGFNGARAIRALGGESLSISFAGGHSGEWAKQLLVKEGLPCRWLPIQAEIRTCMMIVDPEMRDTGHDATVINEDGPPVTVQEWQQFHDAIVDAASQAQIVTLCGSLPNGVEAARLGDLVRAIHTTGAAVWVDNRGKPLEATLPERPTGVKCNAREASTILNGYAINGAEDALAAAQTIQQRGIPNVIITLGVDGAVMVNAQGRWRVRPPRVKSVNSAGSGDAFLGGLAHVLASDGSIEDALRTGSAAGAANALTRLAGEIYAEDIQRLLKETLVEKF